MPAYSNASLAKLATADERLQRLFEEVVKHFDNSILNGIRTVDEQQKDVAEGLSKTMNSKHLPDAVTGKADAVDAAPYPQNWDNSPTRTLSQFEVDMVYFAGFVQGIASQLGITIRYGGDWDMDQRNIASGFEDLDHFELHNG